MAWIQIAIYLVLLILLARPLGEFMARLYSGERHLLTPVLGWLERGLLRLFGVRPDEETTWKACWECVVAGKPAAAVARDLGLTVAAVYAAKSRVLRRLREELGGLLD